VPGGNLTGVAGFTDEVAGKRQVPPAGFGLRVIAATTTLAMGVNTPASSVIIAGLDHRAAEPQVWPNELRGQGVPGGVLGALQRGVADLLQATLRAKKAVACLLFVSGRPMNEIEGIVTQFGGGFGGAAGPIRSVSARTCDLMPVAARVAEILHPTLDLGDRVSRLAVRLTHGVPAAAVDLAKLGGADLLRGDYRRLAEARLCEPEQIEAATDGQILACVDMDRRKLALIRDLAKRIVERRAQVIKATTPILDAYVA
jgi:helicase